MNGDLLNRAQVLIQQNKYNEAEKEIKSYLSANPDSAHAFKMLGIVYVETKRDKDAEAVLKNALTLSPNDDIVYYLLGRVQILRKNYKEAAGMLNQAISINPYDADYFGVLSSIKEATKDFKGMLSLAEEGLSIDPENLLCLNNRSTALIKLGRKDEAFKTADKSLELDPENPLTHATYGWSHLEKGNTKKALEHFRESLRLDPNSDYAQAGMLQALKARYMVYRLFLKYAFFMNNLKGKLQWAIIIGLYLIFRYFNKIAIENPALRPVVVPIIVIYVLFALSTWIIGPLSNLFLRFNFYGRYLLSKTEKLSSMFTGISVLLSILALIAYAVSPDKVFLAMAAFGIIMMVPFGSMLSGESKKSRYALITYSTIMFITGVLSFVVGFKSNEAINSLTVIFILLFVGYQFVANYFLAKEK
ncbi:MAG: tetratricopeptide repeat protein [Bacteroidales bacterium]|nr:tetratricopeptide repeat protein [Bacteroidales bacterium]